VQRVTEPGTVKNILQFPARWSRRLECVLNERLYLITQLIERFLLLDSLD
jgi:hypothetical protein